MVTRPFAHVIKLLQNAGLRPTRQRIGLAHLLFDDNNRHITAEELHAEATAAGIPTSLATIYNTLNRFTASGLLREVIVEPGRTYFDTNTTGHYHFFLEETGEITDIQESEIAIASLPSLPYGTSVRRIDVVVRITKSKV